VALGDLRKDAVERTATGLGGGGSSPALSTCGREKSGQAFFAAAERALGPVTVAVANAGIYPNCPVVDMAVEEWDGVIETNMRGRRRAGEHVTQPVGVSARMPMRDERRLRIRPILSRHV
jgi:NAD(P)-dependent dehydrogenase (short-subunit alcohol dehydrogenase family)